VLLDHVDDACVLALDASSNRELTAGEVRDRARHISRERRGLAVLFADGTIESVSWFLALLEARHPVVLADPKAGWTATAGLLDRYQPDLVIDPSGAQLETLATTPQGALGQIAEGGAWRAAIHGPDPHADLAVLLMTSGSTGSPKLVCLSVGNIQSNADQIARSLRILPTDRGVTTLPLFYSFGMSVITSHVAVGSSVLVTQTSVIEDQFWSDLARYEVSFLAGVPTTYAMLKRLGFDQRDLPLLRVLIQAGGSLSVDLVEFFHETMAARGGRFHPMYGQTEASPRIACLPSERLPEKLRSVGPAMAGGELSIRGVDGDDLPVGQVGEVFYRGPNVMMGYAESREDLALTSAGPLVLETGDLGYLDHEGFLYLTGRSKRICKLAGTRVSLDDIEAAATRLLPRGGDAAAIDCGEAGVALFSTSLETEAEVLALRRELARYLRVPPKLVSARPVTALPLLPSGKTDYSALTKVIDDEAELR
jgi:acyl-CoA synthetase (AMP-forming)/AMP-acid ligase II